MGVWTNFEFNRDSLPKRGYLFAGDTSKEEIIFIGTAYGIEKRIAIGDYIIPDNVQALDGLLKVVFDVDDSEPNKDINAIIKNALDTNHEKYYEGKTVSVPSTFFIHQRLNLTRM